MLLNGSLRILLQYIFIKSSIKIINIYFSYTFFVLHALLIRYWLNNEELNAFQSLLKNIFYVTNTVKVNTLLI